MRVFIPVLIFAFVMLFFSPWYVSKGVEVKFSYSCAAETGIAAAADCSGELFNREKLLFAKFALPAAPAGKPSKIWIPAVASAVRGIRIEVPDGKNIVIRGLTVEGDGKSYRVDWKKDLAARKDLAPEADAVNANGTVAVIFPRKIRVRYGINFSMLFIALVAAGTAGALFFWRIKPSAADSRIVFIAAALALMLFPVAMLDVHSVVSDENRFFQKFPKPTRAFPREFESYLGDRFFCRDRLIDWNNDIFEFSFFKGGNLSENAKAFYGKDGWMFSTAYEAVRMAQNRNRLTEAELKRCADNLDALADAFAKRYDAPVFVVLIPDKERVYEEYYPDFLLKQRRHKESRLEQLTAYLRKHSKVTVISPLPVLLARKKDELLFYPGGTHQTWRGGYYAAAEIRKAFAAKFPELKGFPENISHWEMRRSADLDAAMAMGIREPEKTLDDKYLVFSEPEFIFQRDRHNIRNVPNISMFIDRFVSRDKEHRGLRILVVGDSFWGHIGPFMVPMAGEELHVFFGHGKDFVFEPFARDLENFRPQAVIIESTERFLYRFLTIKFPE